MVLTARPFHPAIKVALPGLLAVALVGTLLLGQPARAAAQDPDDTWARFLDDRTTLLETLAPPFVDCFQRRDSLIDPLSPIFHGCLDWHSAVHAAYSHHVLYRRTGDDEFLDLVEAQIAPGGVSLVGAEHGYQQAKGVDVPLTENPYGYGWFLIGAREREQATGKQDFRQMADYAADEMMRWFQQRLDDGDAGEYILNTAHANYSWSLINLDVWARYTGDPAIKDAVRAAAEPLFDTNCPATRDTNPDRGGFQPACLMRLAAVAHIFGDERTDWIRDQLPAEGLYVPPVTNPDGCHQGGLNFTRAFALYQLYLVTDETAYRDNYVELIRYHVGRPDLYAGQSGYLESPGYLCYSHWVAQVGVRAIALSYDPPPHGGTTGEIEHLATVPLGGRGSDVEFASREVVKLSGGATGEPVCVVDELGACLVDEQGSTVFETEVRDFAVVGVLNENARVVDVTDPRSPVDVAAVPCTASQNDIQLHGDVLLVAQDVGFGRCTRPDGSSRTFVGSALLDFADPRNPTFLSRISYERGSHNHTVHPTEPVVYLSDSDAANTGLGNIPIWDFTDPANPVRVTDFKHMVHSPHDVTFNADGTRAYAAARTATYILDTEDPRTPSVISTIPHEGYLSHQSDPTPDGKLLLVSEELGGGSTMVSPGGPVHVYDISIEERPVKVGLIWPDCGPSTCQPVGGSSVSTSHVFRINPDGRTMAIAWYRDGVGVIDFAGMPGANIAGSGAATGLGPRTVAWTTEEITNAWAAKMWQERHPGYLFATDEGGFEIFYVPAMATA